MGMHGRGIPALNSFCLVPTRMGNSWHVPAKSWDKTVVLQDGGEATGPLCWRGEMLGKLKKVKRSLKGQLSRGFVVTLATSSAAELWHWPLGTAGVDAGLALGTHW